MTRYYCEYCDVFLTHDALSVRRLHNSGFKHKGNVRSYYERFLQGGSGSKSLFDRTGDSEEEKRKMMHEEPFPPRADRYAPYGRRPGGPPGAPHGAPLSSQYLRPRPGRNGPPERDVPPPRESHLKGEHLEGDTAQLARTHGLRLPQYGSSRMIPQHHAAPERGDLKAGAQITARAVVSKTPSNGPPKNSMESSGFNQKPTSNLQHPQS